MSLKLLIISCTVFISTSIGSANPVEVLNISTSAINLVYAENIDDVGKHEYVCAGGLQVNVLNDSELLLGICSPPPLDLSGTIGTLPLSCIMNIGSCARSASSVKAEYGNLTADEPVPDTTGTDWDGTYLDAVIATPEHIYQVADIVYFVDARSCVRKAHRTSGKVTTIKGKCDDGTLDIPGFVTGLIYGMTYFKDRDIWVVALLNYGIYVFSEDTEPRLLVPRDEMSHSVSDAVRQIIRGMDSTNQHNDIVWHKVREGVNCYNLSGVNAADGNLTFNDTFVRYISASGTPTIDLTARRANQSDPQLGTSDAALTISPDGSVLLIADTALDKLFFLDIVDERGDGDNIDPLQEVCEKDSSAMVDNPIGNCTFSAITAALWLSSDTILVYERIYSSFRIASTNTLTSDDGTVTQPNDNDDPNIAEDASTNTLTSDDGTGTQPNDNDDPNNTTKKKDLPWLAILTLVPIGGGIGGGYYLRNRKNQLKNKSKESELETNPGKKDGENNTDQQAEEVKIVEINKQWTSLTIPPA